MRRPDSWDSRDGAALNNSDIILVSGSTSLSLLKIVWDIPLEP